MHHHTLSLTEPIRSHLWVDYVKTGLQRRIQKIGVFAYKENGCVICKECSRVRSKKFWEIDDENRQKGRAKHRTLGNTRWKRTMRGRRISYTGHWSKSDPSNCIYGQKVFKGWVAALKYRPVFNKIWNKKVLTFTVKVLYTTGRSSRCTSLFKYSNHNKFTVFPLKIRPPKVSTPVVEVS